MEAHRAKGDGPRLIMPLIVVGVVVFGVATATESSGFGVLYAIIVGGFIIRNLTWAQFWVALKSTMQTSAKIMMIIAFSQVFVWVLAIERAPETLALLISQIQPSPTIMLLVFMLVILILGTFIDVSPAILLLTPIFLPAVIDAGISPIVFGVLLIIGLAIGACTPPVGNCLNVCSLISGQGIGTIFKGALPFLVANICVMIIIIIFPQVVLWLPKIFMN